MILINTSIASTPVRVVAVDGTVDYVHIAGRGKAELADGLTPDTAWLSTLPNIRVHQPTKPAPAAPKTIVKAEGATQ